MRSAWTMTVGVAVLLGLSGGCDRGEPAAPEKAVRGGASNREKLLSLPYASVVEDEADGAAERDGVVLFDEARACPGYNVFPLYSLCQVDMVDMSGALVHRWQLDECARIVNCVLLENGDLLAVGVRPFPGDDEDDDRVPDEARCLLRLSWDGEVKFRADVAAHHDVSIMPDGNIATLVLRRVMAPQVNALFETRDDLVTVLDPEGAVLAQRSILEVVKQNAQNFPLDRRDPSYGGQMWVDIFHCNSVEFMYREELFERHPLYQPGNVLICSRHQDRAFIFDFATGALRWSWGHGTLSAPHDAHVLENGNILLLDNGVGRMVSRVLEIEPLSGKVVWEYRADPPKSFYTATKGTVQRLPNGNTLIAHADKGIAFEVTPAGETVWRFLNPHHDENGKRRVIARIRRYPAAMVEPLLAGAKRES